MCSRSTGGVKEVLEEWKPMPYWERRRPCFSKNFSSKCYVIKMTEGLASFIVF